ncbi:hypothetical protein [Mesorhizobium escarrei]|uniref:Uncharacterized protein n=1 Tax=Mesorhizobium escarrei TaxID=666018 RepID=A0ABM9DSB9_9HYPH|nr:hypothetical protein [Mesorhizobium escarrei]CAH2399619.1 hypothetical protein MES5069_230037 [Mesorhizobium escarrei]
MEINYSTLEADVAAWLKGHLEHIGEVYGEGEAYAAAVELADDPWTALQWYTEDMRRLLRPKQGGLNLCP